MKKPRVATRKKPRWRPTARFQEWVAANKKAQELFREKYDMAMI